MLSGNSDGHSVTVTLKLFSTLQGSLHLLCDSDDKATTDKKFMILRQLVTGVKMEILLPTAMEIICQIRSSFLRQVDILLEEQRERLM